MTRFAALTTAAALVLFCGCQTGLPDVLPDLPGLPGLRPSDQEQISRLLSDVEQAMEQRKIFKVLTHVSQNYRDAEGRDYNGIQAYLNQIFEQYRRIEITRARPQIQVQGDRALAVETFGTRAEPFNEGQHVSIVLDGQVSVYLARQENGWKITEWGRIQ
jgi:hypothetical protein